MVSFTHNWANMLDIFVHVMAKFGFQSWSQVSYLSRIKFNFIYSLIKGQLVYVIIICGKNDHLCLDGWSSGCRTRHTRE